MKFKLIVSRYMNSDTCIPTDKQTLCNINFEESNVIRAEKHAYKEIEKLIAYKEFLDDDESLIDIRCSDLQFGNWYSIKRRENKKGEILGWTGILSDYFLGNLDGKTGKPPMHFISAEMIWKYNY